MPLKRKRWLAYPLVLMMAALLGCSGKEGSSVTIPGGEEEQIILGQDAGFFGSINGKVTFGPVNKGRIYLYALNDDGSRGEFLGSGTTGPDGGFTLFLRKPMTPSVRLTLATGTFVDEATGKSMRIHKELDADFNGSGITGDLQFTPLTNLVHHLAKAELDSGHAADVREAIDKATRLIGAKFGVADIVGTEPILTSVDPASDITPGFRYGLVLGGFSHEAKDIGVDPIDLQVALGIDLSDRTFDGKTDGTPIFVASGKVLPIDAMKEKLATAVREYIDGIQEGAGSSPDAGSAAGIVLSSISPDIPPDPGSSPPPAALGTLHPSFDLSPTVDEGRIALTLKGLIDPGTGGAIRYDVDSVKVVEDGTLKGIKITPLAETASSNADIVFVVDTTGSMGGTIDGVKSSMVSFVEDLRSRALDVRVGVVAFADDIFPELNPAGIPSDDPAAFTVSGHTPLSSDIGDTGPVIAFIRGLAACYKGYCGADAPEGALDSLYWAHENFNFRPGAQKIFILITDISTWGKDANPASTPEVSPLSPWTDAGLADYLRRDSTVHVVSNDTLLGYVGEYNVKYLALAGGPNGSLGTGGTWTSLGFGTVDLMALPITSTITGSALVEYVRTGTGIADNTVRVVVIGPTTDGETTVTATY
ncbi:MAG: VWA domain-containing protein [Nitrospirae bacterium]|nr:VWA domain-containing protein [Nitrospirota bacterium]